MNIEQQRAAFEAAHEGCSLLRSNKTPDKYANFAIQDRWEGWQLAIENDRQQRGEPVYLLVDEESPGHWIETDEPTYQWWKAQGTRMVKVLYTAPVAAQPSVPTGLIAALRNQRQIDREGSQVAVSRQAVDEAADLLDKLAATPAAGQAQQDADKVDAQPIAWFAFADNNGPVPLELYGWDEKTCKHAVLSYARADNWKGSVEGYLLRNGWTLRPVYLATAKPDPAMAAAIPETVASGNSEPVKVPSDDELIAFGGEEQFFLFCDEDEFLDIAKSVLSRFGQPAQPAASAEPVAIRIREKLYRGTDNGWTYHPHFNPTDRWTKEALRRNEWQSLYTAPVAAQPSVQADSIGTQGRWACLLCGSAREGYHGTLDDRKTPCPNRAASPTPPATGQAQQAVTFAHELAMGTYKPKEIEARAKAIAKLAPLSAQQDADKVAKTCRHYWVVEADAQGNEIGPAMCCKCGAHRDSQP